MSFGFGDRLGLATPGHLAALRKFPVAPVLAQQSSREMQAAGRAPTAVIASASRAVAASGVALRWGADADQLRTMADAERTARAGFTRFTIDLSAMFEAKADSMEPRQIEKALAELENEGVLPSGWRGTHPGSIAQTGAAAAQREALDRAAVKFGRAIQHASQLVRAIERIVSRSACEFEISFVECGQPTSLVEHAFVALELKKRGTNLVAVAPRFTTPFKPGVDFAGDAADFETGLRGHLRVARELGPHQISIHNGSDKFSIYPLLSRTCGDLLHVKTSGTSYLEALRVVARTSPELFSEIVACSVAGAAPPAGVKRARDAKPARSGEPEWLDFPAGRQILHGAYGVVLGGVVSRGGRPFREALNEILTAHAAMYAEFLDLRFSRHLQLLHAG